MAKSYRNLLKTLWEKEKLLVTNNFSFSHSVFKRLVSQGRLKVSLCGNGLILLDSFTFLLTLNHTIPTFNDPVKKRAFQNVVEKGENAGNQHFLLFPHHLKILQRQNLSFELHLFCRLQMLSI